MPIDDASTGALRIIFAGTPDFAVPCLKALLSSHHKLIAVYTQPDRPAGRGRKLLQGPVKQLATQASIPVFQPVSLKNAAAQKQLAVLKPDLIIVVAYGLLLPPAVLAIPKRGCINVHASLLPRWRGAAPIQAAILHGDEETGITIMQMDAGLDTGDMLLKRSCKIEPHETGSVLHDRLADMGAETLLHVLADLESHQNSATKQNPEYKTYAGKIEKQHAIINWANTADSVARQIQAFNAWPVAYSEIGNLRIRIWQAHAIDQKSCVQPGTITSVSKNSIDVACGEGLLRVTQIQLPGARDLPVSAVLNSKRELFKPGLIFNNY
jgi:methionyl-tRNA formyltransferase